MLKETFKKLKGDLVPKGAVTYTPSSYEQPILREQKQANGKSDSKFHLNKLRS